MSDRAGDQADFAGAAAQTAPVRSRFAAQDEAWSGYIRLAAQGDDTAFGKLYDESKNLVFGVAMRILADSADAEEVTLDVYTQVWRAAKEYDASRGSPSAWLVLLARSRAIDRVRSKMARARVEESMGDTPERLQPGRTEPEQIWLTEERGMVRAALGVLTPEQRRLIELAFFGGFTHSELAARLNLPLGTVKTRIRTAMGKLKEELERVQFGMRYGDGAA
jgi:RNA polymerase sigma-70 factor (ECF subfamily)